MAANYPETQSDKTFQPPPPAPLEPNLVLGELLALIASLRAENAALTVALADAQGMGGCGELSDAVRSMIWQSTKPTKTEAS